MSWWLGIQERYIKKKQFENVYELASDCRKQIKGFRKYLRDYSSKKKD